MLSDGPKVSRHHQTELDLTVSLSCALVLVFVFFFYLSLLLLRSCLYAELLISVASTLVLVNDSQSKRAEVVSRSSIYLERVQFLTGSGRATSSLSVFRETYPIWSLCTSFSPKSSLVQR